MSQINREYVKRPLTFLKNLLQMVSRKSNVAFRTCEERMSFIKWFLSDMLGNRLINYKEKMVGNIQYVFVMTLTWVKDDSRWTLIMLLCSTETCWARQLVIALLMFGTSLNTHFFIFTQLCYGCDFSLSKQVWIVWLQFTTNLHPADYA